MKLKFAYGLELTFHYPKQLDPDNEANWILYGVAEARRRSISNSINNRLQSKARRMKLSRSELARMNFDSYQTAEFKSPVLHTLDQIEEYYSFVQGIAKEYRWPVKARDWTTGGGHLHISPVKFLDKVRIENTHAPFLNWVFNDPEDDYIFNNCLQFYEEKNYFWVDQPHGEKHFTVSYNDLYRTLELRFFEAPRNWREQRAHVIFADQWLQWIALQPAREPRISRRPSRTWTFDKALRAFNNLLTELNLDPDEYNVFVRRNLTKRFDIGYNRV